jgi:hypothetical protein
MTYVEWAYRFNPGIYYDMCAGIKSPLQMVSHL